MTTTRSTRYFAPGTAGSRAHVLARASARVWSGALIFAALPLVVGSRTAHAQSAAAWQSQSRETAMADPFTQRMMTRLAVLSGDSMEGRRAGSAGSQRARRYLIAELTAIGAEPIGASFEQPVRLPVRGGSTDSLGANVIARIRGRATDGQAIVLSAHYDHLGTRHGQIYNGADDDASGCVALLEIAERLRQSPPAHDVILAFFDGEEIGMPGSRSFVATPPIPAERIAFDLNLDMVSRQDGNALWVSGTSHHAALRPLAERAAQGSTVPIRFGHDTRGGKPGDDWTTSSDHAPFHATGIPFLYLGVEDHPDYHQPGDDAEKVNPAFYRGAVDFAYRLLREVDAWVGRGDSSPARTASSSAASPPASPAASPFASPAASPAASPVVSTAASPAASPVVSTAASWAMPVFSPAASRVISAIDAAQNEIATDLTQLAAIRSPSGEEDARAAWVAARMRAIGLADVTLDTVPNVTGRIRGRAADAARQATVFVTTLDDLAPVAEHQARASRAPYVEGDRVVGPGSHTSSTTAAMLGAARALVASGMQPEYDIVFAAVAREETGLLGMKALYAQWRDRAAAFVDVLGDGRSITYGAIGIHWWQVWAYQPGGHSLTGGLPNVNLGVARAVDRILSVPQPAPSSRTVLNVSMLRSGDVFNRKPDSAWFSVDIRSLEAASIARNEAAVRAVLDSVARETGTRFDMRAVQQTAGGQIAGAERSGLVTSAANIARALGVAPQLGNAGSSNLNVAIAGGTLAIGLGGERGGARGAPGEFADIPAMLRTAKLVALLALQVGATPSRAQP